MIRVSRTFIRPNTNVAWFGTTSAGMDVTAERIALYGNKLSQTSNEISQDGKTWKYSVTWASRADYNTAMADSRIMAGIELRKSYNAANGITESITEINSI